MKKTFAEFFAGIGLVRMGLERAGWDIAWANDIDEEKFAMYKLTSRMPTSTLRSAIFTM